MLVLSRKIGEAVLIGDNIVVYVSSMRDGKVRLGINAPKDVLVLRAELKKPTEQATEEPISNGQA